MAINNNTIATDLSSDFISGYHISRFMPLHFTGTADVSNRHGIKVLSIKMCWFIFARSLKIICSPEPQPQLRAHTTLNFTRNFFAVNFLSNSMKEFRRMHSSDWSSEYLWIYDCCWRIETTKNLYSSFKWGGIVNNEQNRRIFFSATR